MSKEELKNQIEGQGITHSFSEGGYCFEYVKPEDVEILVKIRVQEALEEEIPKAHTEGQAFLIKTDNLKHGRYPIASEVYYQTQVKPKYE